MHPRPTAPIRIARLALAAAALAVLLGACAPAAFAARDQESIFQDDTQLLASGPDRRDQTLDQIKALGATTIHSLAYWFRIAPEPAARRKPGGFDGANPAAYPAGTWDAYDGLVRAATARGLSVLLTPAGQAPRWATGCPLIKNRTICKPSPKEFGAFVAALAKRYSGTYRDENEGGDVLPRVSRWSVWNESNLGSWLGPQLERRRGRVVPVAPVIYRNLTYATIDALGANGHAGDQIMLGELAPLGKTTGRLPTRATPPGKFLRDVLCIDVAGRALKGQAAKDLRCRRFRRLAVNAVSHHPYTRGGFRPPLSAVNADEITVAVIPRLTRILDQAAARGRIPARLPIYFTEFGYQTNPPDREFGVPLEKQGEYINQADWLAWRAPRVRGVAQYTLRDDASLDGFQTGLRFVDGRAKPALAAYRLPIWVSRSAGGLRVWGQLRPLASGGGGAVEIQSAGAPGGPFATVKTVTPAGPRGYFLVSVPRRTGVWRLRWTPLGGGEPVVSRIARVASG